MRHLSLHPSRSPETPRAPLDALRRHLGHVPRVVRRAFGRLGAGLDLRGICSVRGAVPLSDVAAVHAAGFGDAEMVCTVALGTRACIQTELAEAGHCAA